MSLARELLDVVAVVLIGREQRFERLLGLPPAAPQLHQRGVDDDPVEPRGELAAALESVDGPEGAEVRRLHGVARVLLIAQDPLSDREHAAAEGADHLFVGTFVTGAEAGQEGRVRRVPMTGSCRGSVERYRHNVARFDARRPRPIPTHVPRNAPHSLNVVTIRVAAASHCCRMARPMAETPDETGRRRRRRYRFGLFEVDSRTGELRKQGIAAAAPRPAHRHPADRCWRRRAGGDPGRTAGEALGRGHVRRLRPRAALGGQSLARGAGRLGRQPAVHRNAAAEGLPVHRAGDVGQAAGRATGANGRLPAPALAPRRPQLTVDRVGQRSGAVSTDLGAAVTPPRCPDRLCYTRR